MSEILTVFLPKRVNNFNKFLEKNNIKGKRIKDRKKLFKKKIWIQTDEDMDVILYREKIEIYYRKSDKTNLIAFLNRLISFDKRVSIKVYNDKLNKLIEEFFPDNKYKLYK